MDKQVFELRGDLLSLAIKWYDCYKDQVKVDAQKLRLLTGQENLTTLEFPDFYGKTHVVGMSAKIPGSLPIKEFPGYFKPDKRTRLGKALRLTLAELKRGIPFEPVLEQLGILKADVMEGCTIGWASGFNIGDRYFISVPVSLMKPESRGHHLPVNPELTALTALEFEEIKRQVRS